MPKTSYMPPGTSVAAYKEVKTKGKDNTHSEIVYNTLLRLRNKMGTASDIAMHCTLDYYEVNRRIKELITDKRIYIVSERGGRSLGDNPCRIYKACEEQIAGAEGSEVSNEQEHVAGADDSMEREGEKQGLLF